MSLLHGTVNKCVGTDPEAQSLPKSDLRIRPAPDVHAQGLQQRTPCASRPARWRCDSSTVHQPSQRKAATIPFISDGKTGQTKPALASASDSVSRLTGWPSA